ncbi:MAG: FkbM family methyltransferase [bacterium]|nr:FkbM family methyltransferase [bacterium]
MARRKYRLSHYVRTILRRIWSHPANRDRRVAALLKAAAWQVNKRFLRIPLTATLSGGAKVRCHPDSSAASGLIYFNRQPEFHEMEFVGTYLRQGDHFIDGGANIGVYTLLAASLVGHNGGVEAFEPHPVAFSRLRENVKLNGYMNVRLHQLALSDQESRALMITGADVGNRLQTSIDVGRPTVEVQTCRLDSVLGNRKYSMGKLDIEGAEFRALMGAGSLLVDANPPVWQLEMTEHLLRKAGKSTADVESLLRDAGFLFGRFDGDSRELILDRHLHISDRNIFAVAESATEWVTSRLEEAGVAVLKGSRAGNRSSSSASGSMTA